MKHIVVFCVIVTLSFSACASVWKFMGVATEESVAAKFTELQQTLDDLSAKTEDARKAAEKIAKLEALVKELQGEMDSLPAETLQRIADIMAKAAAEAKARAQASGTAPAAPTPTPAQ